MEVTVVQQGNLSTAFEEVAAADLPSMDRRSDFECVIKDFSTLHGRIGILGGSFDPVHVDHIEVALHARETQGLDLVILMPTPQSPLKGAPLFSEQERMEMLVAAVKPHPELYVSPYETDFAHENGRQTALTFETLSNLRKLLPEDSELFFLVGADCLNTLHTWDNFHELFDYAELVPIEREHTGREFLSDPAEVDRLKARGFTDAELSSLRKHFVPRHDPRPTTRSSTEIREHLVEGVIPFDDLSPGVALLLARRFSCACSNYGPIPGC